MEGVIEAQDYEVKDQRITRLLEERSAQGIDWEVKCPQFSWSNWGFGRESLIATAARLARSGIGYIELHGNRYGADLGYEAREVNLILGDHGLKVSGICGMFSAANDLSSNQGSIRQAAIDYIRRNVELGHAVGASYFLVVPAAVGRPQKIDDQEMSRSAETLRRVADVFSQAGIKAAIEPIRSAEVSIVHTIDDALRYIQMVDHPAVQSINGDIYHMLAEEEHIGEAILRAGSRLVNLHLADSNRGALGRGQINIDTIIRALLIIGLNEGKRFATAEPLGPGGDPYPAMHGEPNTVILDDLVHQSISYWNKRVQAVLGSI